MSPTIPLPPHDEPLTGGSPFPPIADYAFLFTHLALINAVLHVISAENA